jgi:hypothetical protein
MDDWRAITTHIMSRIAASRTSVESISSTTEVLDTLLRPEVIPLLSRMRLGETKGDFAELSAQFGPAERQAVWDFLIHYDPGEGVRIEQLLQAS